MSTQPPQSIDSAAFNEAEFVNPVVVDKLRTVVQNKLGWGPLEARAYFAPLKKASKAGMLTVGTLLQRVADTHGSEAALAVYRAIWWLSNERTLRRLIDNAHKRQQAR